MLRYILAEILITTILMTNVDAAKTIVVEKNNKLAKDSNSGTAKFPLKTIQRGINLAQAGDTVIVMPGIYNENLLIKRSGDKLQGKIVIKSFEKYAAVIDGTNIKNDKLIYWNGTSDGGKNKNYITFDGFEVINAKRWAFWIQGDYNELKNLKVHDSGKTAIQLITGSHNKFFNNEIYNTGWNGISWESNNSNCGIRTDSNIVERNYIHDLKYHVAVNGFPNEKVENSLEFGGYGNMILNNIIKDCLEGIYLRYEKKFVIAGNLLDHINKDGIFLHYDSSDKDAYQAEGKIINNTIVHCGYNGISNSNAMSLIIINNIFYDNGDSVKTQPYYSYDINWYPVTASIGNIMNANLYYNDKGNKNLVYLYSGNESFINLQDLGFEKDGMQANPEFVKPDSRDYYLKSNSPAIDSGINLDISYYMKDLNFTKRPQGERVDIGAYEFLYKK